MKRIRPDSINAAKNGIITFAILGKGVPVSIYSFVGLPPLGFLHFCVKLDNQTMRKDAQQVLRQNPQNRSVYELVKVLKEITYPVFARIVENLLHNFVEQENQQVR